MKISVVICNYNYARFLGAAIDSVLAQTYRQYEIIVVDDGSTDESADILQQYQTKADGKLRAIFQKNQGQAAAFNTGYAAATGDVIAFLDSDDVWSPDKLQRVADVFQEPEVMGVMHQFNHINAEGQVINPSPTPTRMPSGDLAPFMAATGGTWCFAATSGLSYRRAVLDRIFPIDAEKWALCADGALAYCTAFLGRIETINEILAGYRIHGANNHFSCGRSEEKSAKAQAGMEMTNRYLNGFLARIGSPTRVSLDQNLYYRRERFYAQAQWNFTEVVAIVRLILGWPLYTPVEHIIFLARFLVKCAEMRLRTAAGLSKVVAS